MKRVLMVAFHFPPFSGGSGIQRTLRFVQHLPKMGWQPIVVSADPHAYPKTSLDLMGEIPEGTIVQRAYALDTARHCSLWGHYPRWMAVPDRWISWRADAIRRGIRLIKEYQPDVIWSTYPIATAHLIGAELQRRSGLPWVADFRDPMAQDDYPTDLTTWNSFKRIEESAMRQAACCVFTTPGAARTYRNRYTFMKDCIHVIENGFDEDSFAGINRNKRVLKFGKITLLHSGIVYPSERDPTQFFAALAQVHQHAFGQRLRIRFRAAVHEEILTDLAAKYGVQDMIELCPPLTYRSALVEMLCADGLLLMQAANCNDQIPAKFYEYLRANRPILGLTDSDGDTANALHHAGIHTIAPLDSVADIAALLPRFVMGVINSTADLPFPQAVKDASRQARAKELAGLLDSVTL